MQNFKKYGLISVSVIVSYGLVILVNALANAIPFNGILANEVSDSYPNLFAPANIAFSIWGIIFFFLAIYCVYQLVRSIKGTNTPEDMQKLHAIGIYFIISSIANVTWVFTWHFLYIWLSVILMLTILIFMILINLIIFNLRKTQRFSWLQQVSLRIPFSLYFGWITVATIANVTTFLVSSGFNGLGFNDSTWMIAILIVGLIIAMLTTIRFQDFIYPLAIVWGYLGIIIRHFDLEGFNSQFPEVIWTATISIVILLLVSGWQFYREFFQKN